MGDLILETKLLVPRAGRELVPRGRLTDVVERTENTSAQGGVTGSQGCSLKGEDMSVAAARVKDTGRCECSSSPRRKSQPLRYF